MKKPFLYILLLILPAGFFITTHCLKKAQGEFYLNSRYDPSYVYLLSSLNMAQMNGVVHSDHPGTPLQVIGAAIVKIVFYFSGIKNNISEDVLSRQEFYLNKINFALIVINCFVLFIFGIMLYKIFTDIFKVIFLQLTPFSSFTIYYEPTVIAAESLLIPVMLMLLTLCFRYIYKNTGGEKKIFSYALCYALLCGFGIASKITFIPLIIIPFFILSKFRNKIIFLALTVISFLIFFLPAISNIGYFTDWIRKLLLYNGLYGEGQPTIIKPADFFPNILHIMSHEKFFLPVYFLTIILIVFKNQVLKKVSKENISSALTEYKLLTAFAVVMTVQIIIVAKHFSLHYMLSAVMLTIPSLFLILQLSIKSFPKILILKSNIIFSAITLAIAILITNGIITNFFNLQREKNQASEIAAYIDKNYSGSIVISSYGTSDKNYAQAFPLNWAGSQSSNYRNILSDKMANSLFYDFWDGRIYSVNAFEIEKNFFSGDKKIAVWLSNYSSPEKFRQAFNAKFNLQNTELIKQFETPRGEVVYEVKIH